MLKKKILQISIILAFLTGIQAIGQEKKWNIDPAHSGISFTAEYMSVTDVQGKFTEFTGTAITEGTTFNGTEVDVTIRSASIDTDNDKRDGHLRSEDFLYTEKFPEITFKSLAFSQEHGEDYQIKGELTIRGITKTEVFDVEYKGKVDMGQEERAGFVLTGKINRFDYDVDWSKNFSKGLVVSKEIKVKCDVLLISEN